MHSVFGTPRPRVLVVGSWQHSEFAPIRELLQSADVICNQPLLASSPDVVLVAQSHPGAIPQQVVDDLNQRLPETPLVCVLGSWCEGETRTGRPLTGVQRVFWYQFPQWWRRYLTQHGVCPMGQQSPRTVLIDCVGRDTFEALADTLPTDQCTSVWLPRKVRWPLFVGPAAAIWVGAQLTEDELPALERFCSTASGSGRIVAMLDFPRRDRAEIAQRLGADVVLGMPWREEELCDALGLSLNSASTTIAESAQRDAA